ncbi:hypothetical protein [Dietzia maris]|uniref:hypothetical protein n=1 Tax=Dietzia maris TaxID=37915 RepID=UPI0037CB1659
MSTKITAENAATIEVGQLGITVVHPEGIASIWARLTAEQRAKLAAALAPERTPIVEGRHVHGITTTGYVGDAPINPADCDRTTVYTGECRNFADTEWIRFDSGRRRSPDPRDGNTWLIDANNGSFWMADDKVRNLVPLVPAAAPAVSRADIEKAILPHILGPGNGTQDLIDDVHALLSGSDPAVHVIHESELPTVNHPSRWRNFDLADGTWRFRDATDGEIGEALETVESDLRYLLVISRAIEAEQAADPVEEKAEELMRVLAPETEDRTWGILTEPAREDFRRLARHVLAEGGDDK